MGTQWNTRHETWNQATYLWNNVPGGQSFAASAGTVIASVTIALVGQAINSSSGLLTANNDGSVALIGTGVTVSSGTVAAVQSLAASGIASTSAAGSLTPSIRADTFTGQAITSAAGSMQPSGNNVTVHVSGVEGTFFAGSVLSGNVFPTGQASTSAAGIAAPQISLPLLGMACTCSAGSIAPGQDAADAFIQSAAGTAAAAISVALTGSAATGAQGSVTVSGDAFIALTGSQATSAAGSVGIEEAYPLTGSVITSAQQSMGAPGGAALTGSSMTATAGQIFTDNDRQSALVGQSMTASIGSVFASPLAFLTGAELTATGQGIGPRNVALVGAVISAQTGFVIPPAIEILTNPNSGGYERVRRRKPMEGVRRPTDEEVQRERERLGILPPSVQRAVEKVVAAQLAKPTDVESAEALAERVTEPRAQVRLKTEIRREIPEARAAVPADAAYIAQTLILDALVRDWEQRQRAEQAAKDESAEIQELVDLWLRT